MHGSNREERNSLDNDTKQPKDDASRSSSSLRSLEWITAAMDAARRHQEAQQRDCADAAPTPPRPERP